MGKKRREMTEQLRADRERLTKEQQRRRKWEESALQERQRAQLVAPKRPRGDACRPPWVDLIEPPTPEPPAGAPLPTSSGYPPALSFIPPGYQPAQPGLDFEQGGVLLPRKVRSRFPLSARL